MKTKIKKKQPKTQTGTPLMVQWLRIPSQCRGHGFDSQDGELSFHMPQGN